MRRTAVRKSVLLPAIALALPLLLGGPGASGPVRAADLFLTEEPEVYAALDKLNASGALPRGFLANTRPYAVDAVRAAVAEALSKPPDDALDVALLRWVSDYLEPMSARTGRATAGIAWSDDRFIPANNEGIPVPEKVSFLGTVSGREESTLYMSAHIRAATFQGEGGDDGSRLLDAAIDIGGDAASLQLGRLVTWYGPGRRGALVFTNNAPPYAGVRLHNRRPIPITGFFSFLGHVQYDFFIAQLDKKPVRSRSRLVGTRFALRPVPQLEVGVSRALHYGGDGSSNDFSEFFSTYFDPNDEDDPPDRDNSLAGFDVTLTLPFPVQPVQAYWERVGEREAELFGMDEVHRPSRWGDIVGLYFPRILSLSRLDLRLEYADDKDDSPGMSWYDHPTYPHRYKGLALGHAMGGAARELFAEARYYLSPSTIASLSFERVTHGASTPPDIVPPGERRNTYSAGLTGWLDASWRGEARASLQEIVNRDGVPGSEGTNIVASLLVSYRAVSQPSSFESEIDLSPQRPEFPAPSPETPPPAAPEIPH